MSHMKMPGPRVQTTGRAMLLPWENSVPRGCAPASPNGTHRDLQLGASAEEHGLAGVTVEVTKGRCISLLKLKGIQVKNMQ